MASTWPTTPSSTKKKLDISDPLPGPSRAASCTATSRPPTHPPSSAFPLSTGSTSRPSSPQKRSWADVLDRSLSKAVHQMLVCNIIHGKPHESTLHHCRRIQAKVAEILNFTWDDQAHAFPYRDRLLSLLGNQPSLPANDCEWNKLLLLWCRRTGEDIGGREIFHILAVDGFRGFAPKCLKYYLVHVLVPLRIEYQHHVQGIRAMYEHFEGDERIQSLTGTDSAHVVFLALLRLFVRAGDLLSDDQVRYKVVRNQQLVEGYLYRRVNTSYQDLKNVDLNVLDALGEKYLQQWPCSSSKRNEEWKGVALELLGMLEVPQNYESDRD